MRGAQPPGGLAGVLGCGQTAAARRGSLPPVRRRACAAASRRRNDIVPPIDLDHLAALDAMPTLFDTGAQPDAAELAAAREAQNPPPDPFIAG